jgi:hypothetical protein
VFGTQFWGNYCKFDVHIIAGIKTEFRDIVEHYVKTAKFVTDVVAVLPIEWFSFCASDDIFHKQKIFAFLKLNRLLKLYRVSCSKSFQNLCSAKGK